MIRDQCTRLTRFTRFTKLLSNYQITIQDLQGQITIKISNYYPKFTRTNYYQITKNNENTYITKNENDRTV